MDPFSKLHILVPIDFSPSSFVALDWALRLACRPSNVHVLHVCPSLVLYEPAAVFVMREDEVRAQYTDLFYERFSHGRYGGVKFDIRFGDPGTQITIYAATSHGRTGLSHLLLGSVAERTVQLASCPVLVLRGQSAAAPPWADLQQSTTPLGAYLTQRAL